MALSARVLKPLAVFAGLFGILTIVSGGSALFGTEAMRARVGDAVPFVLWFNFLAGFVYLAAAWAILKDRSWAFALAVALGLATLLVFGAFGLTVANGTPFEMRTVGAMTLRAGFWLAMAWLLYKAGKPGRTAAAR